MQETTTPTPPEVLIEFNSLYFKGPIKLEIIKAENGTFALDRYSKGPNRWNRTAHENGFRAFPGAVARLARQVITFGAGPIKISSPSLSLEIFRDLGHGWKIVDLSELEEGAPASDAPILSEGLVFSATIYQALRLIEAEGMK